MEDGQTGDLLWTSGEFALVYCLATHASVWSIVNLPAETKFHAFLLDRHSNHATCTLAPLQDRI